MPTPLVSIILPTFDRAAVLQRAIRSTLNQSYTNLELVVVDDGSTDDSQRIILDITDKRVRVVNLESSGGAAAARNAGIEAASGDWVAFQDSDDEWHRDKLEAQMTALHEHGSADVCVCSYEHHKRGKLYRVQHGNRIRSGHDVITRLLGGESYATPTLVVKRLAIDAAGGFDKALRRRQDFDLCLRLAQHTSFVFLDQVLMTFNHGEDSISAQPELFVEALELLLDKHARLFDERPGSRSTQYFRAGKHLVDEGRFRSSLPLFRQALAANPRNWKAAVGIAGVVTGVLPLLRALRS